MMMMIDAFQPLGVTRLAVDSIFMMPHLGVLSTVNEKAAIDVFVKDCLILLGTCLAAGGTGRPGEECLRYRLHLPDGKTIEDVLQFGEIRLHPLEGEARIEATPAKGFDLGAGKGKRIEQAVQGGVAGLVLDARGRPLALARDKGQRVQQLDRWAQAMGLYPE